MASVNDISAQQVALETVQASATVRSRYAVSLDAAERASSLKRGRLAGTASRRDANVTSTPSVSSPSPAAPLVSGALSQGDPAIVAEVAHDHVRESTTIRRSGLSRFFSYLCFCWSPRDGPLPYNEAFGNLDDERYANYPKGVPRLAALQNYSENCAVYRMFGRAFCCLLLRYEVEINTLIARMDRSDKDIMNRRSTNAGFPPSRNGEVVDALLQEQAERNELFVELEDRLNKYSDLFLKYNTLKGLGTAPLRHHRNICHWILKEKHLGDDQYAFINQFQDFITPIKRYQGGNSFNDLVEGFFDRYPRQVEKVFSEGGTINSMKGDGAFDFDQEQITKLTKLIVIFITILILLIPVFVFFLAKTTRAQAAGVTLVFAMLFAVIVSFFTDARVENILIGTCAYCAVLVSFLGNVQNAGSGVTGIAS